MTCHSSLVLPSSSSATCFAWELSLGGFKLPSGLPPKNITVIPKREGNQRKFQVLGHKWCMPTNYKVTITIVIKHHLPTLFFSYTYIVQEFNGCRFCVFKVLNAIHWSWSYQQIIWSHQQVKPILFGIIVNSSIFRLHMCQLHFFDMLLFQIYKFERVPSRNEIAVHWNTDHHVFFVRCYR